MPFSKKKLFTDALSVLLVLAIFFFLGREFAKNWNYISAFTFNFNAMLVLLASAVYAVSFLVFSFGWYKILAYVKTPMPFWDTLLYFCITQPSKYMPGKIWLAVTRMKFCAKHNVPNSITLLTTGIESAMEIFAGTYISLLSLIKTGLLKEFSVWAVASITAFGLVILYPPVFYLLINLYLKITKRPQIPKEQRVSFTKILFLQLVYVLGVFLISFAQVLFLQSFMEIDPKFIPLLVSIGALTYAAGILAVFSPGGLGVREGIWYVALKQILAAHVSVIYAFASRIWTIIVELILSAISLFSLWLRHKISNRPAAQKDL